MLLAVLTIAFGGLLLRATWLQGVRAESLARLGQTQHRETVTLPATRGTLYDRSGLAASRSSAVSAVERKVTCHKAACEFLSGGLRK